MNSNVSPKHEFSNRTIIAIGAALVTIFLAVSFFVTPADGEIKRKPGEGQSVPATSAKQ